MGNTLSLFRLALSEFLDNLRVYQALQAKAYASPGFPRPNPTLPYWTIPPSPIAQHVSELPDYADVVIIGSGITGTSFARALLDRCEKDGKRIKVVMLEAREACSGATGRNGGHITPQLYHDYLTLKEEYGEAMAHKIIRFRLAHVDEMLRIAEKEDLLAESQVRRVETADVYFKKEMFDKAKAKVEQWAKEMSLEAAKHRVYEGQEAIETFNLASDAVGCITCSAGAIHPYRFVTGILARLLERHSESFSLCTQTTCTSISAPSSSSPHYVLATPRGTISTSHVIHATNGWASTLLEPMRGKIIPFRGNMSAQRPGRSLTPQLLSGQRSFVFYSAKLGYDYLTQLPGSPAGAYELMLGGGFAQDGEEGLAALANTDDTTYDRTVGAHLSGVLPRYFGEDNWGAESGPGDNGEVSGEGIKWHEGRVKAFWSGVVGLSTDMQPWVGRVPPAVSGRREPSLSTYDAVKENGAGLRHLASPGEWISAGYSGEGMVHAWMCGKALATMVLDREIDDGLAGWFPDIMRINEKRWKKASPERMLEMLSNEE